MILGLTLIFITGLFWAGLAVVVAESSRRDLTIRRVLPLSAIMVLVGVGWICFTRGALHGGVVEIALQMSLLVAAGVGNYLMIKCVHRAMGIGNGGLIWGITQSSMVIPFIMGLTLFHEPATATRLIGIGVVLTALFLFSSAKSTKTSDNGRGWLVPTLAAFALSGMAQCSASLPSYLQLEGMTSLRRMCLTQVGIILAAAVDMLWRREAIRFSRAESVAAGCFGAFNLVALCCFYHGLNLLADCGYASVGYPVGQGSSIVIFYLFNSVVYRERASMIGVVALVVMIIGLALIAMGIYA